MPTGQQIFQLRIELDEVTPAVWRRLLVPGGIRLATLHLILQAAMGRTNSHLHAFTIDGERYGMHLGDDFLDEDLDLPDAKSVTVLRALGDRSRITYEYDFGAGWGPHGDRGRALHAHTRPEARRVPRRANACPPEDCGGSGGYEELLLALADPSHEDHDDLLEWIGGPFDPTAFDLVATNVAIQHVH